MQHVITFINESCDQPTTPAIQKENIVFLDIKPISEPTSQFALKSGKKSFYDQTICIFFKMVEKNSSMVRNFPQTNALSEKIDRQMDRLIDKL